MTDQQRHLPVITRGESGDLRIARCSCGHTLTSADPDTEYAYHLAAMQAAFGTRIYQRATEVLSTALQHPHIRELALAWAKADRTADDRGAHLIRIERMINDSERPVPVELLAARAQAQAALTEACAVERDAESALKDAAVRLLDDVEPDSAAMGES